MPNSRIRIVLFICLDNAVFLFSRIRSKKRSIAVLLKHYRPNAANHLCTYILDISASPSP